MSGIIQKIYNNQYSGDDLIYISSITGNDNNDGKSKFNPKKTIQDYNKKYYFLMEGTYSLSNLDNGDVLPFDCEVLCEGIEKVTIEVLQNKVTNGYYMGWNTLYKNHIYNATINVYVLGFGAFATYNINLKFFNSLLNITGYNYNDNHNTAVNCHVINNGSIQGGGKALKCDNSTIEGKYDSKVQTYCIEMNSEKALKYKPLETNLVHSGNPDIFNIDLTQSNIGITGGPHFYNVRNIFNGSDIINSTITIEDNIMKLECSHIIENMQFSDKQSNLKVSFINNTNDELLLEETIVVPNPTGKKTLDVSSYF